MSIKQHLYDTTQSLDIQANGDEACIQNVLKDVFCLLL